MKTHSQGLHLSVNGVAVHFGARNHTHHLFNMLTEPVPGEAKAKRVADFEQGFGTRLRHGRPNAVAVIDTEGRTLRAEMIYVQ